MARPNEADNLAKLLGTLPGIESQMAEISRGSGEPCVEDGMLVSGKAAFIAYPKLAELMGCSSDDARRTVEQLCEAETGSSGLGIYPIGSAEELAAWGEDSGIPIGTLQAEGIMDGLGGPFAIFEDCPRLLLHQPRLTAGESWALLEALDRAGVGQDIPFVQELQRAVMSGSATRGRPGSLAGGTGRYRIMSSLSLLCAQHRKAVISYDPVFGSGRETAPEPTSPTPRAGASSSGDGRTVLPLEVFAGDNGEMYLFAYRYAGPSDGGREDVPGTRSYKVDRILDVRPLAEHETDPGILSLERERSLVPESGEMAHVRLSDGATFDERRWLHARASGPPCSTGGSRTVELPLLEDDSWIARSIASKLGDAEVLGPSRLRDDVAATARRALDEMDELDREFGGAG